MGDKVYRYGQFVWRELMSPNPGDSIRFYGEVVGWKTVSNPMPDGSTYTMFMAGSRQVGGCMKIPAPTIPPHWGVYEVSVTDVDAAAVRASQAGGKVLMGPTEAGQVGRFATIADPQGAVLNVWKSATGDSPRIPTQQPGMGEFCWEQLNTTAPNAAAFYSTVFGWTEAPSPGRADLKVWSSGTEQVASCMPAAGGAPSHWMTYVVVDALKSAGIRVEKSGGKVLMPRIEIPTGGAICVVQDNVGAHLGLYEMPKN